MSTNYPKVKVYLAATIYPFYIVENGNPNVEQGVYDSINKYKTQCNKYVKASFLISEYGWPSRCIVPAAHPSKRKTHANPTDQCKWWKYFMQNNIITTVPRYYWVMTSDTTQIDCMDNIVKKDTHGAGLSCSNHFGNDNGWRIIGWSKNTPCWKCTPDGVVDPLCTSEAGSVDIKCK